MSPSRRSWSEPAPRRPERLVDDRLGPTMKVHLVDGTYELFRHFFGAPPHTNAAGEEVAAVRGVLGSVLQMLGDGATHVGVATDHVIESFRNELWPGYKTGEGVDPDLWSQAWPLEEALVALGVVVWPMVDLEADDALASAAAVAGDDAAVEQVVICTPDKDLGQCVSGTRIVQLDRRKDLVVDEAGVAAKFGVGPASLRDDMDHARLFKDLATLRVDRRLLGTTDDLRWRGPTADFTAICDGLDAS